MKRITHRKLEKSGEWKLIEERKPSLHHLLKEAVYEIAKRWCTGVSYDYVAKLRENLFALHESMSLYYGATRVGDRTFIIIVFREQNAIEVISNGKILHIKLL